MRPVLLRCGAAAMVAVGAVVSAGCGHQPDRGAFVESVEPGGAAAEAGIVPGDVIVAWRGRGDGGRITGPLPLALVEEAFAPRGPVELTVVSRHGRRPVILRRGLWGLRCRPPLPDAVLRAWRRAAGAEGRDEAAGALERLAADTGDGDPRTAAWLWLEAARSWLRARSGAGALRCLGAARMAVGGPATRALVLERGGKALVDAGRPRAAAAPLEESLRIRDALAPGSPEVAWTIHQLARTDFWAYAARLREADAIYAGLGTQNVERAAIWIDLGIRRYVADDLDGAEQWYRRALERLDLLAPRSRLKGNLLINLGLLLLKRGAFREAAGLLEESLRIHRAIDPGSRQVVYALNALGLAARRTGRYARAVAWYRQALDVAEAIRPDGVEVAGLLNNLGNAAQRQGDLPAAMAWHRRAARLRHRLRPGSADEAASLHNLGIVAQEMGDDRQALRFLERALVLKRAVVPGTLSLSNTLQEIGMVRNRLGDVSGARSALEEAIALRRSIVPGGIILGEAYTVLGEIEAGAGRPDRAERWWREALGLAERRPAGLVTGTEERAQLVASLLAPGRNLVRLMVRQGRDREAFRLLERLRTAVLRSSLAGRSLLGSRNAPDGAGRVLDLDLRIDRLRGRLARMRSGRDEETRDATLRRLAELERRRAEGLAALAAASQPLHDILEPPPSTPGLLRRALADGTVVLEYCVGRDGTTLFVLENGEGEAPALAAVEIPAGEAALRRKVELVRGFLGPSAPGRSEEVLLGLELGELFDMLVGPALGAVSRARNVVVVPGGPLQELPFAALRDRGHGGRFLGVWRSLAVAPSATAFADLAASRDRCAVRSGPAVVAAISRLPRSCGASVPPLPHALAEARRVAGRWPRAVRLEEERATADALLEAGAAASVLHLAVHGTVDRGEPWESALLLWPGPRHPDGRLSAADVALEMRTRARVVVLSSCSGAGGKTGVGGGVAGLAKAFEIAGAHTVVAAVCPVSDRATAELMDRFHAGLAAGLPTGEALRRAREALSSGPVEGADGTLLDLRHPAHWAAFRVLGDWW